MKNKRLENLFVEDYYLSVKIEEISGRYITNKDLELVQQKLGDKFRIDKIGNSVKGESISLIRLGSGKIKILAWSQMHGNEGTTTKAVFDLLNAYDLADDNTQLSEIFQKCTLYIIPVLSPDGARAYTRVNANQVDLNRDMQDLSQPESKLLMEQYKKIQPDFCLNLHDQRTIFSAGEKPEPATLSFLTPSMDKARTIDVYRKKSMAVIAGIAQDLSAELPGRIGRYGDAFNINCAGDTFQNLSTPTILFEAGHHPGDYEREVTRKFIFKALISCIYQISNDPDAGLYQEYFKIPENRKLFNDVVIRNAKIKGEDSEVAIQFKEILKKGRVDFIPEIVEMNKKISNFAHREIDAEGKEIQLANSSEFGENVIVDKIIINNTELRVKYE
ncbi:peptidase M14 [Gramella lutea]|uniref:Peptidase M14 n=1 Tax=Christiangramia lutea TaxID=1607951 RepID=A0A9X1V5E8_9FLAO|nr:M14 family zinc carboxypeptidase [Christiangramia lutea]MCH4823013.1 peptidase M14 [Christiangramia lutea]